MNWQPFRYADFWDIPHWIYTTDGTRAFLLDCPFDDALDDYPGAENFGEGLFTVYAAPVLALPASKRVPWEGPAQEQLERLGTVVLTRAHLDPTFRELLDWDLLEAWL